MPRKSKTLEEAVIDIVLTQVAPFIQEDEVVVDQPASDDRETETPADEVPLEELQKPVLLAGEFDISDLGLAPAEAEAKRLARKPAVDHLELGTAPVEGLGLIPLFNVGDRIVVERHTTHLRGTPWLDTRILTVLSIDDVTGHVRCNDPEAQQVCLVSFMSSTTRIFLCPRAGNPFKPGKHHVPTARVAQENASGPLTGDNAPKKRGRPKGSKNRSRELINAEKEARKLERREKKAKRARKGGAA